MIAPGVLIDAHHLYQPHGQITDMRFIDYRPIYLLVLLLCLSPALSLASEGGEQAGGTYPGYLKLDPPLVVNLASQRRAQYLKIDVQFFIETPHDAELVTLHMPLIRDRMITLLGGRAADQIASKEAREQLRTELLAKLRETMTQQAGAPAISAIYFTGFIIQ